MIRKRLAKIFLPKTELGEWPVGLILIFFILLEIFRLLDDAGERDGETFFSNLKLSLLVILAGIAVAASLSTGLISILKYRERSLPVLLATLISLLVVIFLIAFSV